MVLTLKLERNCELLSFLNIFEYRAPLVLGSWGTEHHWFLVPGVSSTASPRVRAVLVPGVPSTTDNNNKNNNNNNTLLSWFQIQYNTDIYSCGHKYRDTLNEFSFAKVVHNIALNLIQQHVMFVNLNLD